MPLENTQDGAAADIEEPGFLLDLAPSLTVLLSHPTHSSALLDYELALLSSSLEQVHTAMPHIQLQSVLQTLSHLLLRPSLTADICHLFRPIIIDLVARWLLMHPTTYESALGKSLSINTTAMLMATASVDVTTNAISEYRHQSMPAMARRSTLSLLFRVLSSVLFVEHLAVAFSRLLPIAPQIKAHAIAAFQNSPSLFHQSHFCIWNPEPIYALLTYPDAAVRMYAAYSLSILIGMSDAERNTLLEHYTDKNNIDPKLALLPLVEQLQTESMHARMFESTSVTLTPGSNAQPRIMMDASSLSCLTVDMCGVLLPHNQLTTARFSSSVRLLPLDTSMISSGAIQDVSEKMTKLVHIKSTVDNLHQIGIAISLGLPVLLEGPPGVGKTALVEEASRILGSSDLLKIHLGDQTDSKLLLGTYMTTSTPGAFKWQPGVLVTAVSEGRWILIEDIDLAPVDVVAVLVPLLETRWLYIPSRGERIQAKDSFRIFATRRSRDFQWKFPFRKITSRFPVLRGCVGEIMRSYDTLNAQFREMHAVGRQLSSRDLIKWCYRVSNLYQKKLESSHSQIGSISVENQREDLFREAFDCFMAMIPKAHLRQQIALCLGETLQIPQNRIEFYFENFIPNVTLDIPAGKLLCGRVVLPIFDAKIASARHPPFAPTAPSLRLIERLAVAVSLCEPILLVGETGTGKTTVVQHLASHVGSKLTVINMSQQSDSTDLLGGFKPVDALLLAAKAFIRRNWHQLSIGFERAVKMAKEVMSKIHAGTVAQKDKNQPEDESAPKKKRKHLDPSLAVEWDQFEISVNQLSAQLEQIKNNFLFSFVEGSLIQALRNGHWILLDEVNLASAETLECLSGLLQSSDGSIMLLERGDTVPIRRHPNFRLFACMNPANDAGKRDLPPGLRSRFTEFWVESPDACQADLLLIIRSYIFPHLPAGPAGDRICLDVAEFYSEAKSLAVQGILFDGADQRVHISMRTLTRALSYAMFIAPMYGIKRSLYEATYMTFMTGLGIKSWQQMMTMLRKSILNGVRNPDAFVKQIPKHPGVQDDMADLDEDILRDSPYTLIDCFWIEKGPLDIPTDLESAFVLTPSVQANLVNLSRAVLSRKYPVLIQGPTSAGKTSMVEYLAKRTGHRFLRINNHEHTDIQEYLGSYISNDQGALAFQDGVLVEALRKGYWIVLDELNLAPSDVLEALNRLLDDNRELFLPETQEVIKPHPHFMLFATQNPAGQYGGRKQLSRAFRNRFVELHFSDIPEGELEMIMEKRCRIAPSYAKRLVSVYKSLQKLRGTSRIFDGRQSFITLRDLFRWALRGAVGYQRLAEDGYMQLAERVRKLDDRAAIKKILEKEFKVVIDEEAMYDTMFEKIWSSLKMLAETSPEISCLVDGIVWTQAMRRLFVLVHECMQHYEPVLLVGETGCGKTTVCQILAALAQRHLHIVNAHQNSETADFLGSQRPTRGREQAEIELRKQVRILIDKAAPQTSGSFDLEMEKVGSIMDKVEEISTSLESLGLDKSVKHSLQTEISTCLKLCQKSRALFAWTDGPLVQAMKLGHFFLLDEISLADDSVIERLNSVLEPQRLLVLAENGAKEVEEIIAADEFRLFATMNPGGDYGKKELSPALRNRFTEIWVPSIVSRSDLLLILEKKLCVLQIPSDARILWGGRILDFLYWLAEQLHKPIDAIISLRDILAWASFLCATGLRLGLADAFFHGGCMVLIDGMSINPLLGTLGTSCASLSKTSRYILRSLSKGVGITDIVVHETLLESEGVEFDTSASPLVIRQLEFGNDLFCIPVGNAMIKSASFAMQAPTTLSNCMRVLRALQLNKPILLEGSPGVGKTSLIASLAAMSRHRLVRINLSEQTDLMDLFGSDLPVENGHGGEFAWRDGPFLKAMQEGDWVLLDELNLASQQVLEGLNSCLDHRATIYIPELDRNIACHPSFRVFAAQNPQNEGGGRKGLPKSFSNRFSQVYVSPLDMHSLRYICSALYPHLDTELTEKMIVFNERIREEIMVKCSFGWRGAPWEFNLHAGPGEFLEMIYTQRMRTRNDRNRVREIFVDIFGYLPDRCVNRPTLRITPNLVKIGNALLPRVALRGTHKYGAPTDNLQILPSSLPFLESLVQCIQTCSLPLLVGPSAVGKSSLVRLLSSIAGQRLHEITLNPGVDALELLGGFEQVDLVRRSQGIVDDIEELMNMVLATGILKPNIVSSSTLAQIQADWSIFCLNRVTVPMEESMSALRRLLGDLKAVSSSLFPSLDAFEDIQSSIEAYSRLADSGIRGRFEWMDSALVRALKHGDWILIDNVNLCSESVLDRLNSLVETNGCLIISERGLVDGDIQIITPHPNFRLFMAMDPTYGEISRAMRNRSVEIYIDDFEKSVDSNVVSVTKLTSAAGFLGDALATVLARTSSDAIGFDSFDQENTDSRTPVLDARLIVEHLQRGDTLETALMSILDADTASSVLKSMATYGGVFPTCWPLFVSGKLTIQCSELASVASSASAIVMYTSSLASELKFVSPVARMPLLSELPSIHDLVVAALDVFIQDVSVSDLHLRKSWLSFWAENLGSDADPMFIEALKLALFLMETDHVVTAIGHAGVAARAEFARVGISGSDADKFPVDLQLVDLAGIQPAKSSSTSDTVLFNIRRFCSDQFIENSVYDASSSILVRDLNISQLSYSLFIGKVRASQLPHACVRSLYPLLCSTQTVCKSALFSCMNSSDLNLTPIVKLMDRRRELWESAQTVVVDIAKLVLCIRRISKLLPACIALCDANSIDITSLHSSIEDAWESFSVEKIKALGVLWKLGGITTLRTTVLSTIADQFESVNAVLDTSSQGPSAWIFRRTITSMGLDIKRAIMEGVSTLHYLNEEEEPSNNLVTMLQEVPAKLTESITKLDTPQPISLLAMSGIDSQLSAVTLWPFHDTWALASELTLIEQIYAYLHDEHPDNQLLVRSIRSFISSAITSTSLPPLHFEPLQRLVWVLDSGSNQHTPHVVSDQSQHQFVYTIAQEALHQWNKSFWANGFTFWRSHSMTDRESFMMNGQILQLLDLESEIASGLSMSSGKQTLQSMHVPLYNGLSGHTLAMLESISKVPVYSSGSKVIQMKMLLQQTASPDFEVAQRNKFDLSVLIACIIQFLRAHSSLYPPGTLASIQTALDHAISPHKPSMESADIERLKEMLLQVKSARMQTIIKLYLSPMIDSIAVCSQTLPCSETQLNIEFANAWVLYALAFLEAYIPDLPVDPVAMRTAKISLSTRYSDRLKADILVNADKEFLQTANPPSPKLKTKLADLEDEAAKMFKWRSKLPIRPSRSQMVDIVNELQQVKQSILHLPTIKLLLVELVSPSGVSLDILHQEESLQDVVQSVIDRIEAKYPHYRDLLLPACTALYQLKYGIRLMRHAGSILHLRDASTSVAPLVRFVQDFQLENLDVALENASSIRGNSRQLMQTKLKIQLATIEQLAAFLQTGTHIDVDVIIRMHALFDAVVDLWGEAEVQRQRMEEEKESLFIMKQASVVTDEEREEAEFRERFPDFFETFADIAPVDPLNDSDPLKNAPTVPKQPAIIPTFDPSQAWRIVLSYKAAVDTLSSTSPETFSKQWGGAFLSSLDAAMTVCQLDGVSVPPTMDVIGRLGFVYASAKHVSDFSTTTVTSSDLYDFYNDSNVFEAQQIQPLLVKFDTRINALLVQWPDHDVLVHLSAICRRVASFPVASPLMKLLTGIELLLTKSQDWEAYASKEVSLRSCLDDFVLFIVKWRRLELNTWRQLLKLEERRCAAKVGSLWFHLWRTTMGILRNPKPESHELDALKDPLVNDLFTTFDNLCLSSPVGQFEERLQILRSFHKHLLLLEKHCPCDMFTGLKTIINLLWNVTEYYFQFLPSVQLFISTSRKPILTELKKYVKIATWKDVNVFALKESAKRTHYNLNKFVKKYMLVLEKPVKDVIASFQEAPPSMSTLPARTTIDPDVMWDMALTSAADSCQTALCVPLALIIDESNLGTKYRVSNTERLLAKMKSLTRSVISENIFAGAASGIEEFSATILERVKAFRDVNVAAQSDAKIVKGQKMMRKKALVDLLRYLAVLGLSQRCRQRFAYHQDPFVMNSYAPLDMSLLVNSIAELGSSTWMLPELRVLADRTHEYHFRNLARIAVVRSATLSIPPDLTLLETERGISSIEHLLNFSLEQRDLISSFSKHMCQISSFVKQMHSIVENGPQIRFEPSRVYHNQLVAIKRATDNAMIVVSQSIDVASLANEHGHPISLRFRERLTCVANQLKEKKTRVDNSYQLYVSTHLPPLVAIKDTDTQDVDDYQYMVDALNNIYTDLSSIQSDFPEHDLFIRDAVSLVKSGLVSLDSPVAAIESTEPLLQDTNVISNTLMVKADVVVERLLVAFQHLRTPSPTLDILSTTKLGSTEEIESEKDEFGLGTNHLIDMHNLTKAVFEYQSGASLLSSVADLLAIIDDAISNGDAKVASQIHALLTQIAPLFGQYYALAQYRLLQHFSFSKAISKLTYVLANLFASLLKEGFCLPKSSEGEDDENAGAMEDNVEGTGMGEGDDLEKNIDDEDNGIEMTNDFDGVLEDVDGDDDDEMDDPDDKDDDQEPDEEMGDLDKDLADVVDEKLWGDDDKDDNNENAEDDEKTERDAPVDGGAGESEIVAEENGSDEKPKKEKDPKEATPSKQPDDDTPDDTDKQDDVPKENDDSPDVEDNDPERINEDAPDKFEDSHGVDVKAADDLDKDGESDDDDVADDGSDIPDKMDIDEDDANDSDANGETNNAQEDEMDIVDEDVVQEDTPQEIDQNQSHDQSLDAEDESDDKEPDNEPENEPENAEEDEEANRQAKLFRGEDSEAQNEQQADGDDGEAHATEDSQGGKSNSKPERRDNKQSQPDHGPKDANPRRSVGDAMKQWLSRLKHIAESSEEQDAVDNDQENTVQQNVTDDNDFEFVENDEHAGDTQALGAATDDQLEKMDRQALADDEKEGECQNEEASMDVDEPFENIGPDEKMQADNKDKPLPNSSSAQSISEKQQPKEKVSPDEPASTHDDASDDQQDDKEDNLEEHDEATEEIDYASLRRELESRMMTFRQNGVNDQQKVQELWRSYVNLTRDLAFSLCEQLRLILEPTLATKLKGDYRTGKRLNMRKVISYIASQFKKDKIWLRRTKPSKRTYQVMVAVDDSRSMSESHSIQLAFESLAMISKALTQLEVGDIGIVRFGENVQLVHPFEKPFTDDAGADLIRSFTFEQDRTHVKLMMESAMSILEHARFSNSQSSADLWQLQLVISDGICEDHEYIRSLVRKATEERIMIVFIILDNRTEKDSILNMTNVSYEMDFATQRPILKMDRYMDTFPFDYYVVVRDIERLPEILAETLRQFFMFVSS
ncbi:hypothetical protein BSLG_007382 [Batrachochytrium salamandrivorans]|nr:hypothetical protein BSLG_007382 [Batrachochytrium salamandrivorans]